MGEFGLTLIGLMILATLVFVYQKNPKDGIVFTLCFLLPLLAIIFGLLTLAGVNVE